MRNWLLPEYIEDVLPAEAFHIETMRRRMIDLLMVHGYQQVSPPLLEYVESLLSGSGSDMNLQMFKVIDQLSGRMMGLRADMTPQVARIDAHLLNCEGVTRLCYANNVLHTVPSSLTQTREPFQIGAELYGHSGIESDLEIQHLMLKCLAMAGLHQVHLDLGHVAVFRAIIKTAKISLEMETELFAILQAKDIAALKETCAGLKKSTRESLLLLPELYGDQKILDEARKRLPTHMDILSALNQLDMVSKELKPAVSTIAFDLADLRGYHYHSGMVFAAYAHDCSNAIALGGRYDEIGKAFGRARPATGFSMDLRELSRLVERSPYPMGIRAPYKKKDKELDLKIEQLRNDGQIVITELPEQPENTLNCDRKIIKREGEWIVEKIKFIDY
ncbi:ATP phosphoribosyltransferase regulatory subunit [Nitrosomonas aestuarii]|uniref:ATP phosphoribosyltransferase regulatory subunit n=1 Tax=Nitrosomonas aestuarii TaxID=52441 RepID=A0A1I3YP38_9PROT|nr:ATP phosphoribosyltransferase regulatory subunit [Nitrosomonas aestuarii]SFK33553.1 ATP phosphoribosyltransferase regulatory subunit [Nitrosomonas aestuarii]